MNMPKRRNIHDMEVTNSVIKQALDEIQNSKSLIQYNQGMIYRFEKVIKDELVKDMREVDSDYVALGTWTCMKSPTGSCFYDSERDPCRDECLICGEPAERK